MSNINDAFNAPKNINSPKYILILYHEEVYNSVTLNLSCMYTACWEFQNSKSGFFFFLKQRYLNAFGINRVGINSYLCAGYLSFKMLP